MACRRDAVRPAPLADRIAKCFGESLGRVIVIAISRRRWRITRQIPEKLRQTIEQIFAVRFLIRVEEIIGEWQDQIARVIGPLKDRLFRKLRLIREDRGDGVAEIFSQVARRSARA